MNKVNLLICVLFLSTALTASAQQLAQRRAQRRAGPGIPTPRVPEGVRAQRNIAYVAGGHLVALVGTSGDVKEFDVGENLDQSSRVQAVCDYYGPTDFKVFVTTESTTTGSLVR